MASLTHAHKKKSHGVISGDLDGQKNRALSTRNFCTCVNHWRREPSWKEISIVLMKLWQKWKLYILPRMIFFVVIRQIMSFSQPLPTKLNKLKDWISAEPIYDDRITLEKCGVENVTIVLMLSLLLVVNKSNTYCNID